jgi:hypothetical protein
LPDPGIAQAAADPITAMRHIAAMSPPTPSGLARTEVQVRTGLAAACRLGAMNG